MTDTKSRDFQILGVIVVINTLWLFTSTILKRMKFGFWRKNMNWIKFSVCSISKYIFDLVKQQIMSRKTFTYGNGCPDNVRWLQKIIAIACSLEIFYVSRSHSSINSDILTEALYICFVLCLLTTFFFHPCAFTIWGEAQSITNVQILLLAKFDKTHKLYIAEKLVSKKFTSRQLCTIKLLPICVHFSLSIAASISKSMNLATFVISCSCWILLKATLSLLSYYQYRLLPSSETKL